MRVGFRRIFDIRIVIDVIITRPWGGCHHPDPLRLHPSSLPRIGRIQVGPERGSLRSKEAWGLSALQGSRNSKVLRPSGSCF